MERGEALLLLREMEKIDGSSMDVNSEEFKWWRENFPETPDRILKRILGQGARSSAMEQASKASP
jgi:hypothetical protein